MINKFHNKQWSFILYKFYGVDNLQFIDMAIARAQFEEIEDEEPFYAEVPGLPGVWATGKTIEECRENLRNVIDGWIDVRRRRGLQIPSIFGCKVGVD